MMVVVVILRLRQKHSLVERAHRTTAANGYSARIESMLNIKCRANICICVPAYTCTPNHWEPFGQCDRVNSA